MKALNTESYLFYILFSGGATATSPKEVNVIWHFALYIHNIIRYTCVTQQLLYYEFMIFIKILRLAL